MRAERNAWGGGSLRRRDATRRDGPGLGAAAVLVAGILVGCNSGVPAATPAVTTPAQPGATESAQPGMTQAPNPATPGSPADAFTVTAITYADDTTSPLAAVAELGPNDAGISRLDLYRNAQGRLASVVVHREEGPPGVIAFDTTQRPVRIEIGGYVAELTYPATDVEVVVTAPDGSVVRERGPLAPGAVIPAGGVPNARLVSWLQGPPMPGMVPWPIELYSYSTVRVEVAHVGTNPGTVLDHVGFAGLRCTTDAGVRCAAELLTSRSGAQIFVRTSVKTGEFGEDKWLWRTEADCAEFAPVTEQLVSVSGWGLLALGGVYQLVSLAGSGYPPLGASLWALGAAVKVLGPLAVSKPNCGSVPNLEKLQDSVFKDLAGTPATIAVAAAGDCGEHPDTGWRIKDPAQTFTFQPFLPAVRAPYASTKAEGREVGTIRFEATDCAVAMGGEFDLVSSAATAGVPKAAAAAWAKQFTENAIMLEIKNADLGPSAPIDVTGTFTLTVTSPDCCGRGVPDGCTSSQTTKGILEGLITQAGGYLAKGRATVSVVDSKFSCAAPQAPEQAVAWSAVGDATSLDGTIELPSQGGSPAMSLIFTVRAW